MENSRSPTGAVSWLPANQAARISDLSLDMVNYLCRHGYVTPSYREVGGRANRGYGVVRKYTYSDVLLLRVISRLLAQGISIKKLGKALASLQKRGKGAEELRSMRYILTDGNDVYFQNSGTLELLKSGQLAFAFVVDLQPIRKEIVECARKGMAA